MDNAIAPRLHRLSEQRGGSVSLAAAVGRPQPVRHSIQLTCKGVRLFFAVQLPADVKERLRPALDAARRAGGDGVGFTRLEQVHFTLAFLGEQPSADAALQAGEILTEQASFELAIGGIGAFPNNARPRVLWLGVTDGAAPLMVAAERLRRALEGAGFSLEERRF